ncbi:MAG: hypothetical protein JKY67_09620 [Pseudomonadales bacterium]|nr:hypothetical protein [Pseudomonadales bacterium]
MSQLKKVTAKKAADITQHYEMGEEAAPHLEKDISPFNFVKALLNAELYSEAVNFLAHALPKRESVWWACQSAKTDTSEKANTDALLAAEAWVRAPKEELRKNCMDIAEKDKLKSSASWAALAAYWSSGSIADDSVAQIPPPPFQYALAVSGAVNLAAAAQESVDVAFKELIKQGIDIANGGGGK